MIIELQLLLGLFICFKHLLPLFGTCIMNLLWTFGLIFTNCTCKAIISILFKTTLSFRTMIMGYNFGWSWIIWRSLVWSSTKRCESEFQYKILNALDVWINHTTLCLTMLYKFCGISTFVG